VAFMPRLGRGFWPDSRAIVNSRPDTADGGPTILQQESEHSLQPVTYAPEGPDARDSPGAPHRQLRPVDESSQPSLDDDLLTALLGKGSISGCILPITAPPPALLGLWAAPPGELTHFALIVLSSLVPPG
jgi:hypothetical protein